MPAPLSRRPALRERRAARQRAERDQAFAALVDAHDGLLDAAAEHSALIADVSQAKQDILQARQAGILPEGDADLAIGQRESLLAVLRRARDSAFAQAEEVQRTMAMMTGLQSRLAMLEAQIAREEAGCA